jgi:hypothetical protein
MGISPKADRNVKKSLWRLQQTQRIGPIEKIEETEEVKKS